LIVGCSFLVVGKTGNQKNEKPNSKEVLEEKIKVN
jgi:hypothetical protein